MPPLPLVLPAASTIGRDGQVASARLINGYPEYSGQDAKSPYSLYGAPGLTRWDHGVLTGAERGMIELSSNELIAVLGNQIVSFDQGANDTFLANLVGSGRVFMALNRASPPQIGIVTSAGQYYVLAAGVLTLNADPDLPAPNSIDYLRGRFLYGVGTLGRVYASDADNGTSINALAFADINSNSDPVVRVIVNGGYFYAFGTKSLEIWQPDPSLAGQPFPFSPVQQDIEYGLTGAHTAAKFEKALIWVDQNFIVRHGRDGGAVRASNHAVERSIGALTQAERALMVGSVHSFQGHETYTLKGANFTWCLDLPFAKKAGFELAWYERKSYALDHWRVNSSLLFNGKYIMGDESNGRLYYLNPDDFTENANDHVLEIWCPHSHRFPERLIADGIEVDMVSGVGLNSSTDSDANPEIMIDFSENGGKTFAGERRAVIGRQAEFQQAIRLNKWGRCTKKGRTWRVRASAAVLKAVNSAALWARATR